MKLDKMHNETKSQLVQKLDRFQLEISKELTSDEDGSFLYIGNKKVKGFKVSL